MNNQLVSIIMSVYDGDSPEFLREAIQSIIDQDYPNIEIILIRAFLVTKKEKQLSK